MSKPDSQKLLEDYEQEQLKIDREWYNGDEESQVAAVMESQVLEPAPTHLQSNATFIKNKRKNMRKMERQKEHDIWELQIMQRTGIASAFGGSGGDPYAENDDHEDEENKVHVMTHDLKPPFLDSRFKYTKLGSTSESVMTTNTTSDLYVNARKGSQMIRDWRERRELMKKNRQAVGLEGSQIGEIIGHSTDRASSAIPKSQESNQLASIAEEQPDLEADKKSASPAKDPKMVRRNLPIFAVREELMKVIRDNNVVIIVGETGSGKSTQLSQYLYEEGYGNYGMIGCTQPRRVAAMSVAKRVADEVGTKIGDLVGYSIRFEDVTNPNTIIKYMTEGILLRENLRDRDIYNYSCIIMDEAHERSLHTDVLMGLLKLVVSKRRDLKLIVTSATMDAGRFSRFFGNAPIFTIPGRTYPVDVIYAKTTVEDYVAAAVKQAISIHLNSPKGDILVFMTGQEDIEVTCQVLVQKMSEIDNASPLVVLPIYSQLPADLQSKIFEQAPANLRKCIVATNIAETSLTVEGIRYVIDTGYCKLKVYNPRVGMDCLQVTPISQANANQRSGRAGRTQEGFCYRMYTETSYGSMSKMTVPEIQRTNLANVVLLLKSLNIKNLLDFDFLDPPPQDTILTSMHQLWVLGALDNTGELTELGKKMVEFPLDPPLSKLIIVSNELGCLSEILTIVAMLSVPNVFYRPKGREEESDIVREKFCVPESDHLTLLHVYNTWKDKGSNSFKWCDKNFIHEKSLKKAREVRSQLVDITKSMKMEYSSCGANWDVIRKCIASSYFHHAARQKGIGEFSSVITGMPINLHPTSALFGLGYMPEYVVYHELFMTSKEYIMCCTAVDPYWLAEYGGKMYSIKESNFGQREKRKLEREQESLMEKELQEATEKMKRVEDEELRALSRPRTRIVEMGNSTSRTEKYSGRAAATPQLALLRARTPGMFRKNGI